MLQDKRYEEDILAVIDYLKVKDGKKFSLDTLESARHFILTNHKDIGNPTYLKIEKY